MIAGRENVLRPLEFGTTGDLESPDPSFDLVVDDFIELDRGWPANSLVIYLAM